MTVPSRALDHDTIAAIATPAGRGGIGIIRVSGPKAWSIAEQLTQKSPTTGQPIFSRFVTPEGEVIDEGLMLMFKGPTSFTGEDIAEFHGHGGTVVTNLLLGACLSFGARLARPGEFSERAFLNDKLDLAQAEGLADLIDAPNQQAARQAAASLRGAFSEAVNLLSQQIIELRVFVEAAIDFPEEEVDFLSENKLEVSLRSLEIQLTQLITQARQGAIMSRGAKVVMTGAPNAGKSSLMNQLAKDSVAIVTDIPGTTRDVIRQAISLNGVPLQISDTAGIRKASDAIEQEGINRARAEVDEADIVIEVIDDAAGDNTDETINSRDARAHQPLIRVLNKIDLSHRSPGPVATSSASSEDSGSEAKMTTVAVSATTGQGLSALEYAILSHLGFGDTTIETPFSARERHVICLERASMALSETIQRFEMHQAGELLAEDLRTVHSHLSETTGAFGADDLLGEIFSSFCIGK